MAHGVKRFETRSWGTSYRGPLAIHAALKKFNPKDYEDTEFAEQVKRNCLPLRYGQVVGVVDLYDCVPTDRLATFMLTKVEEIYGNYDAGRYVWMTRNHVQIHQAYRVRGYQGIFSVDMTACDELAVAVKRMRGAA